MVFRIGAIKFLVAESFLKLVSSLTCTCATLISEQLKIVIEEGPEQIIAAFRDAAAMFFIDLETFW